MKTERYCEHCGKELEPHRQRNTLFCSNKCRQASFRRKKKSNEYEGLESVESVTTKYYEEFGVDDD